MMAGVDKQNENEMANEQVEHVISDEQLVGEMAGEEGGGGQSGGGE